MWTECRSDLSKTAAERVTIYRRFEGQRTDSPTRELYTYLNVKRRRSRKFRSEGFCNNNVSTTQKEVQYKYTNLAAQSRADHGRRRQRLSRKPVDIAAVSR